MNVKLENIWRIDAFISEFLYRIINIKNSRLQITYGVKFCVTNALYSLN